MANDRSEKLPVFITCRPEGARRVTNVCLCASLARRMNFVSSGWVFDPDSYLANSVKAVHFQTKNVPNLERPVPVHPVRLTSGPHVLRDWRKAD